MMQQMELMVNGLGKKVLENQSAELGEIVAQQQQIKAREIARRISDYLTCNFSDNTSRKSNVTALVDCYRTFLKEMPEDKFDLSVKEDYKNFNRFVSNLAIKGIGITCINESLFERDELLKEFCDSDEIKEKVIVNLLRSLYYRNLSKREDETMFNEKKISGEM